jgi:IMP dehydrogenase/GMP reductase
MSERKETFYITRDENQTRIRVTESDYKVIKAYAAHNERTLTAELHYLISEASHCRLDNHSEKIQKLEDQLDQVIGLAQQYKKKYGHLT